MEIVPSTEAEFRDAMRMSKARTNAGIQPNPDRPTHAFIRTMKVGQSARLVNHPHEPARNGACKMAVRIQNYANYHGLRMRAAHDGPDLIIMRVK